MFNVCMNIVFVNLCLSVEFYESISLCVCL